IRTRPRTYLKISHTTLIMAKVYPLLLTILYSLLFTTAEGQSPLTDSLEAYYRQYEKKEITAKGYLRQAGRLLDKQFAQGVLFEREDLVRILEPYKRIAWSADSLHSFRINYYINLSNNTNYANREGESVYFLEKAEKIG